MTPADFARHRRQDAQQAVAEWLKERYPDSEDASSTELARFNFETGSVGWKLTLGDFGGAVVAVGPSFPYSAPRIAMADESLAADPHVEKAGRLCLAGDGAQVDANDPVGQIRDTIDDAIKLLLANRRGENTDDFVEDFEAYWRRSCGDYRSVTTLIEHFEPARFGAVRFGKQYDLIADSEALAARWIDHRVGSARRRTFYRGVIAPIDQLPSPTRYPNTVNELRQLVPDAAALIDELLASSQSQIIVAFGAISPGGRAAQAVVRLTPAQQGGYRPRPRNAGFRNNASVPPDLQANRWRSYRVTPKDALSARTRLPAGIALPNKHVVLVGCGSLGSGVARLLVQTGVGALTLIDDDTMQFENIGRHELGAAEVGQYKAEALGRRLLSAYPQAGSIQWFNKRWEQTVTSVGNNLFDHCDLVISTTGSWNADAALNDALRAAEYRSPLIIGWLERNAAAAQALLLSSSGPCLRCGFDQTGTLEVPLLGWSEAQPQAGCGGPVSPYGAIELAQAQAAVAGLAVDVLRADARPPIRRVWYARTEELETMGGWWHTKWSRAFGDPGLGGALVAVPWPARPGCQCQT